MYCCHLTYRSLYHIITTEKEIIYCEVYMIVDEMVRMKLEKIPVVLRNESFAQLVCLFISITRPFL
jgi:hypothetical protein